jgi:hypothetical protein
MQSEVALTFEDESGREHRVLVGPGRFTIGRGADNDLALGYSSLSREHAVIENTRGSITITDSGSRNGTSVNDYPLVGTVELYDGDRVTLGGSVELRLTLGGEFVSQVSSGSGSSLIAAGAVGALLLVAGLTLILFTVNSGSTNASTGAKVIENKDKGVQGEELSPDPSPPESDPTPADNQSRAPDADQMSRQAKRVMAKISNDSDAFIPEAGIKEIARKVEEYRGSSALGEKLRSMKQSCTEVTSRAQSLNLKPALVMYAALAESEGGAGGDPTASARRMMPKLLTLRATFGTETANSSLLLVAAYPYPFNPPIGSQARTPHPLAAKLMEFGGRRSTVHTSEARSVWFLREKNGITTEAYDLVIRLLAIGVIAQQPRQFGIEAEPPLC